MKDFTSYPIGDFLFFENFSKSLHKPCSAKDCILSHQYLLKLKIIFYFRFYQFQIFTTINLIFFYVIYHPSKTLENFQLN